MLKALRTSVAGWPRGAKRAIVMGFDAVALFGVLWLGYVLRLNAPFVPSPTQLGLMALAPLIAVIVLDRFGVYRAVIRYLPERTLWTIGQAMTLAALIWVAILFLGSVSGIEGVPRSIPLIFWALGIIVLAGSRFAMRQLLREHDADQEPIPVLIYGAGPEGGRMAQALRSRGPRRPMAFIDDDPALRGRDVFGLRVHAPGEADRVIAGLGIREVIFSPHVAAEPRQDMFRRLSDKPVRVRTVPPLVDFSSQESIVRQIRDIRIDDLLGRAQVPADETLLRRMIEGRSILVTGAGGSIGSELARLVARWSPARLVLLDANEFALFEIDRRLREEGRTMAVPVLGSIRDESLVRLLLAINAVDVVFHAAAHKHVPLLEANALEAVRNNVFGTEVLARCCLEHGVRSFVLISSDKAVRPSSVMGATKRWAEMIVADCARRAKPGQVFSAVRFGNVLGSSGSVVELFREQIARGGPVTLTDERMTRYFMSIHEAAELIVQAGALARGGDIMLLNMGNPVPIRLLAESMIRLAGLTERDDANPDGDIAITITGPRPGEKLAEELYYAPGKVEPTAHPKIMRGRGEFDTASVSAASLTALRSALDDGEEARLRQLLLADLAVAGAEGTVVEGEADAALPLRERRLG